MKFSVSAKCALFVLCITLAAAPSSFSQNLFGAPVPKVAPEIAPKIDPLKRGTPRASIFAFLQACHQGNFVLAAEYLDLRRIRSDGRQTQGPELAKQLSVILDRTTDFELNKLSDDPIGRVGDGLDDNLDRIADFNLNQQKTSLFMQRENFDGQQYWLVSPESVLHIRQLAAAVGESPIEKRLPEQMVTISVLKTPLWIWLALLLSAILVALVALALARLLLRVTRPLARRYAEKLHAHRIEAFVAPLRRLVAIALFRTCIEFIGPSALLRDFLLKLLSLLSIWAFTSILMGIVDVISDTITSRLNVRERALSFSVLPLLVRFTKIILGFLAILGVLGAWGYNVNAVLAGLGVGGIAVALAAQKTIENLFGGVSVISDKPVLVGDFCKFGGQVGTVEDIGLRSTRFRTLDRTIVTIPNSSFSTMTLENYSKRDRMWFHPTISLRRDTPPDKIRAMMDAVIQVLQEHPKVDPTDVPLRFTNIGKESFDLEVFAYVNSDDFNVYLETQSELLLGIVEAGMRLSVEFAVPIQETMAPALVYGGKAGLIASNRNASINAPTTGE